MYNLERFYLLGEMKMKKFLSFIMALIVVFSLGANVVFADAYVEEILADYEAAGATVEQLAADLASYGLILDAENMQIINGATGAVLSEEEFNAYMNGGASSGAPTSPSGTTLSKEDYKSKKVAYQIEKIGMKTEEGETVEKLYFKVTIYVMGTDAYLDYLLEDGATQQAAYEESTFMEKRAIIVDNVEISENELVSNLGVGYIFEEGFLTSKEQYVIPMVDMSEMLEQDQDMDGVPDYKKGDAIITFAFKFGDDIESFDVVVGQPNSKIITHTNINWIPVLIILLGIIVIVLGGFIVFLTLKGKKKVEKQNSLKNKKYVSEDKIFEALVEEAGIDVEDEEFVEEIEEIEEETEETEEIEESEEDEESEEK